MADAGVRAGLSLVISLLVGGHEVVAHRIAWASLPRSTCTWCMLTWPMIAIGWVVNLFQRGTASVVRIDELLKEKPEIEDARGGQSFPGAVFAGEIEFRD